MSIRIIFVNFLVCILFLRAGEVSPRIANYTITATLFPETKSLTASEKIVWFNKTCDKVSTLQFHLYMNAFRGPNTTFMRESKQSSRFGNDIFEDNWGHIEVTCLKTEMQPNHIQAIEFIRLDDGNADDDTVIETKLPGSILPGDSLIVYIDFEVFLPEIIARSGYKNNFFMVGQWFPKLGVYEEQKGWNCHQYHANSEFYADFGVYDVTIRLPKEYRVGATGYPVAEYLYDDSSRSIRFIATDVHDFAWAASDKFEVITEKWQGIDIRFFYQPEHKKQIHRQMKALIKALEFCSEWFGLYPYPNLTVIDPPDDALEAGGMEYPTLITAGFTHDFSKYFHFMEELIIHEFCHQYWYGIVANNEFEEAWLDEGFTTYSEMKIIDSLFGGTFNFSHYNLLNRDLTWIKYALGDPKKDIIVKNSWEYPLGGYYTFSYAKPALLLLTLENFAGEKQMRSFFKIYFEKFKYKHVTTKDFINTFCEEAGYKWYSFLEQVLYSTDVLDYRMYSIDTDSAGVHRYRCEITAYREGNIICPVEVHTVFEDGSSRMERWGGEERYRIFIYESQSPVLYAEVDPNFKNKLDINRLNNSIRARPDRTASAAFRHILFSWMQSLLHFLCYWM